MKVVDDDGQVFPAEEEGDDDVRAYPGKVVSMAEWRMIRKRESYGVCVFVTLEASSLVVG